MANRVDVTLDEAQLEIGRARLVQVFQYLDALNQLRNPAKRQIKEQRWHFWRLEGPGFVWNYRVLPHVHTFVNISSRIG